MLCPSAEAKGIIGELEGTTRPMAGFLYGCGLRLTEALRLRVKDIDLESQQITVRDGKGEKDRITLLPVAIKEDLRINLKPVESLHRQDLERGFGSVLASIAP